MRRQLREAARSAGDTLPSNECLNVMIRRWEDGRSGMSERYRLHYCGALQIPVEGFGDPDAIPATIHEQRHGSADAALSPADQHRLWFLMGYVSCLLATATKEHNGTT